MPIFLGLSLRNDKEHLKKLRDMLLEATDILKSSFNTQVVRDTVESITQIWRHGKQDHNGWKNVDDFHVTVMHVGKDEDKMDKPLY